MKIGKIGRMRKWKLKHRNVEKVEGTVENEGGTLKTRGVEGEGNGVSFER